MSKTESILVGVVSAILCPLLVFDFFWWTSAAAAMSGVLHLSERGIAAAALAGLGLGIIMDAVCLKVWISRFYSASLKVMMAIYLCCSVIAVASCMGLPLGNLLLGALAGLYVGRKEYHAGGSEQSLARAARRAAIFTALVTGVEALPIGLLALNERTVARLLEAGLGVDQAAIAGPAGAGLVVLGCLLLMLVQFWCTRMAARLAFGPGRGATPCAWSPPDPQLHQRP
jgi:hypothetical protein